MRQFIQKNVISLAIAIVAMLILISGGWSFYNRQVMVKALELRKQVEAVKYESQQILETIKEIDISSRGFAHMHEDRFLYYSIADAKRSEKTAFTRLDSLMHLQGYSDLVAFKAVQKEMDAYIDMYAQMIGLIREKNLDGYKALLNEDRGDQFVTVYGNFANKLLAYQDQLNQQAQQEYEAALARNSFIQVLLMLVGLPTLGLVFHRLKQEALNRQSLLLNLARNNAHYLFDSGQTQEKGETKSVLDNSIENLKKAAEFITQLSEGNYQVEWPELNQENQSRNENNLVGKLVRMREQMKKVKLEDEKRLWTTEGLSTLSEIIRSNQHSVQDLSERTLTFLVKYLQAQQGGLFQLQKPEGGEAFLEMIACYAFDRKKYREKRVEIGQGIVGQTYLEAEPTILTRLPSQYTTITSGLGGDTPTSLLVVPLKYNNKVEAIIEIASFLNYDTYQVAFLEKAGEFIASAIASAHANKSTSALLQQLQHQTEEMRAQEEEMRQNMEELEATQEEMRRKEQQYLEQIAQLESRTSKVI